MSALDIISRKRWMKTLLLLSSMALLLKKFLPSKQDRKEFVCQCVDVNTILINAPKCHCKSVVDQSPFS